MSECRACLPMAPGRLKSPPRPLHLREKGVRSAQKVQAGPRIPVRIRLHKALFFLSSNKRPNF
jgi:hypothetical protein